MFLINRIKGIFKVFMAVLFALPLTESTAQPVSRPAIIGIAYVELKVSDIKRSFAFYEGLLGYECKPSLPTANQRGSFDIQINQRQSIRIQGGLLETQDERFVALGFQTTDVEAMRFYLKSKGISVPDKAIKESDARLSFSAFDPDGHELKFIQYISTGNQPLNKTGDTDLISDRILHVGLTINDLKKANGFYGEILGFSEIWKGGINDTTTNWVNMRLPESTDYLEYMLITAKPNRQQLGVQHHIALLTLDIQKALDLVRSRAQKSDFLIGSPRIGRNNRWQLNLFDPDGTRIELMEPFTTR